MVYQKGCFESVKIFKIWFLDNNIYLKIIEKGTSRALLCRLLGHLLHGFLFVCHLRFLLVHSLRNVLPFVAWFHRALFASLVHFLSSCDSALDVRLLLERALLLLHLRSFAHDVHDHQSYQKDRYKWYSHCLMFSWIIVN